MTTSYCDKPGLPFREILERIYIKHASHDMLNDFLKIVLNANMYYLRWPQFQTNPFSSLEVMKGL